jgi:hypothetical protein
MSTHGNGGAFGGKMSDALGRVARRLADEHGRTVRVLCSREDVVRLGPKRPPIGVGVRFDGSGVMHAARTPGLAEAVAMVAPDLSVVEFDVAGPPTSIDLRAAGWMEAAVVSASLQVGPSYSVRSPDGAVATASVGDGGAISISVSCGEVLDEVVLSSYSVGAAHMAYGMVTSEGLSVDTAGEPHDQTIRSFGVVRAVDTPVVDVTIERSGGPPVNGSDAVFAAVATAVWAHAGFPPRWPTHP